MRIPTGKQQSGFTLVELVMVMVILGVVAAIGIPSFTELVRGSQMTSRANSLIGAMKLARSEAISRGRPVSVCPSTDGQSCGGDWAAGWLVATDAGTAGSIDAADGDEVLRVDSSDTNVSTAGTPAPPDYVRFLSNGLREGDNTQTIRLERPECGTGEAREIEISATGRAQVNKADC